jgi:hypothetical protein
MKISCSMASNHGAEGLVGQNLKQHGMWHTTINDVNGIHATFGSIQGTTDFGQHAPTDGAIGKQLVNASRT